MAGTTAKILPRERRGDPRSEVIFISVGRALSHWELLQERLVRLYGAIAGCPHNFAVLRSFGFNMVVNSKLDMIEYAAVALRLRNKDLYEQVHSLINRIREFNERRNDIAHGIVAQGYDDAGASLGNFLGPSVGTTKKWKEEKKTSLTPAYCWTAAQIDRYLDAFIELEQEGGRLEKLIMVFYETQGAPPSWIPELAVKDTGSKNADDSTDQS